jgi:hypothetical protein
VRFIFHFIIHRPFIFSQGFDEVVDGRDVLQSGKRNKERLSFNGIHETTSFIF